MCSPRWRLIKHRGSRYGLAKGCADGLAIVDWRSGAAGSTIGVARLKVEKDGDGLRKKESN